MLKQFFKNCKQFTPMNQEKIHTNVFKGKYIKVHNLKW